MSPLNRPVALASVCFLLAIAPSIGAPTGEGGTAGRTPAATGSATPQPPAAPRNIGGPGDYGLREKLIKRLGRDADLGPSRLRVVLVNGGAVLSGTVPHWTARRRALVMAGAERGIINVTDQMEIDRGTVKDAAILKAMAALLEEQREALGIKDLDISVGDGIATLSGTVRNFAARVRAEDTVGTVLGATRVINRLRPGNAPTGTDDPTLRRALAGYLKDFREYPYPGKIQVDVREGTARLTGRVPLYLARQQAGTMAALVGGVREVDNRIAVDPSLQMQAVSVTEAP
jgi:osmotically-inducible protein OsmY